MHVSTEYPAGGEGQDRPEPVRVQNSGHVDDDIQVSALDVFWEIDGRKSRSSKKCWIGIEKEDAGDLRINE